MTKKDYEAPVLICEEVMPDTMIASIISGPKNGNWHNHTCYGYRVYPNINEDGDLCIGEEF